MLSTVEISRRSRRHQKGKIGPFPWHRTHPSGSQLDIKRIMENSHINRMTRKSQPGIHIRVKLQLMPCIAWYDRKTFPVNPVDYSWVTWLFTLKLVGNFPARESGMTYSASCTLKWFMSNWLGEKLWEISFHFSRHSGVICIKATWSPWVSSCPT